MTTHNAYKCFDSHFLFFYSNLSTPETWRKGDPRDATYNTSLLTDELHSRKGYSVDTMASFPMCKTWRQVQFSDFVKAQENGVSRHQRVTQVMKMKIFYWWLAIFNF